MINKLKYSISLIICSILFINTSYIEIEFPIFRSSSESKLLQKILAGNKILAIFPEPETKSFQINGSQVNLYEEIPYLIILGTMFKAEYPSSLYRKDLGAESFPEEYFNKSLYSTHISVKLETPSYRCSTEIFSDFACVAFNAIKGIPTGKDSCMKNTGVIITNIPVSLHFLNTNTNESFSIKKNRSFKSSNSIGNIECPMFNKGVAVETIQSNIEDINLEIFPKIARIPRQIISKNDPNPEVNRLFRNAYEKITGNFVSWDYAMRLWQKADIYSNGNNDGALANIAIFYLIKGETELALEYFERAKNLSGSRKYAIEKALEDLKFQIEKNK